MDKRFKDTVAIVTGGSRGIGRAIVLSFAQAGAKVAFTYAQNEAAAGALLDEIRAAGGEAIAFKADVKSYAEARRVVTETSARFGGLDILVNNAGIVRDKALMTMEPAEWQEVIDTNLTGYFNMARSSIVTMLKQKRGVIINISSVAGVTGLPRQVNYSSAKAGIIGMTKALAKEVAPYGVRVNAVAPGYIETDMTKDLKGRDERMAAVPLGRFGTPDEVARTVLFLAGDASGYITGQVLKVDGGMVM